MSLGQKDLGVSFYTEEIQPVLNIYNSTLLNRKIGVSSMITCFIATSKEKFYKTER